MRALLVTLLLLTGCTLPTQQPESRPTSQPTSQPASRPTGPLVVIARTFYEYPGWIEWVSQITQKICSECSLPETGSIILLDEKPIIQQFTEEDPITGERSVIYHQGLYDPNDCGINIWLQNPFGSKITFEEFKGVLLHELLHHYYQFKGLKFPVDHNKLFADEITRLGWDKL